MSHDFFSSRRRTRSCTTLPEHTITRLTLSASTSARFLGGDGACTAEMIKLAGTALTDAAYCTQAGLPMARMPGGAAFNARFKQRFNTDVQLYAPYAYDAATALVKAMVAAGSAEPEKYLPALRNVNFSGITGTIAFDAKGDIKEGGVTLYRFEKGAWVPL